MYTDEDLEFAVEKEIFSRSAVEEFRNALSSFKNSSRVDEENFKLIGGFNDIFIVIACALLLFSSLWVVPSITGESRSSYLVFAALSWGLAEFFILKRKMALPAIVLLLTFVGGIFAFSHSIFSIDIIFSSIVASAASSIAAYAHWKRFKVPITVAVCSGALACVLASVALSVFTPTSFWFLAAVFLCGVLIFILAMYWDSADLNRVSRKSDVAFWLHLVAAPLVIHPVFTGLGILRGDESLVSVSAVIVLYILMMTISIAIDRRAFMVSSLTYVLYALSSIVKAYGGVSSSFAFTGVFMGSALLLLSAYWHPVRKRLLENLSPSIKKYLPKAK